MWSWLKKRTNIDFQNETTTVACPTCQFLFCDFGRMSWTITSFCSCARIKKKRAWNKTQLATNAPTNICTYIYKTGDDRESQNEINRVSKAGRGVTKNRTLEIQCWTSKAFWRRPCRVLGRGLGKGLKGWSPPLWSTQPEGWWDLYSDSCTRAGVRVEK